MNQHSRTWKIWIDLDNSPHVPFFLPIKKELEARGHSVFVTTRASFQTRALADFHGLKHQTVGRHYGANKVSKILGTLWRACQLAPVILKHKPDLSLSHGSRALILLSSLARIPTILFFDYEHARMLPFVRPALGIAPEVIDDSHLRRNFKSGMRAYGGLKEDVYVSSFTPDASILHGLNLTADEIVITIRPPATEAHYHNPESEKLFVEVVEFLSSDTHTRMVIVPRNKAQRDIVYNTWPTLCDSARIILPDRALSGINLIWHSDLVISGGGTMNREAAALGVPVYSIFRGELGAVDRYLAEKGRLILIESAQAVRSKIRLIKRARPQELDFHESTALKGIMTVLDEWMEKTSP